MRRIAFLTVLIVAVSIEFSCSPQPIITQENPKELEAPAPKKDAEEEEKKPEEIYVEDQPAEIGVYVLAELRKTSCYGKCPVYSIKLYSDGRAIFYGNSNVDKEGLYEAFCTESDFFKIFKAAELANYFVLRSQYPTDGRKIPDLPNTITYLKREGLEKRIINRFDAPVDLLEFEKWLDGFFDKLDWRKVTSIESRK